MEEELRALLLADPALAARCGQRISWVSREQGSALPALVLLLVSGAEGMTQDGPDDLGQYRVQVDAYAASYSEAKVCARLVVARLNGFGGGMMDFIEHLSSRDLPEPGTDAGQMLFRVSQDFLINHRSN